MTKKVSKNEKRKSYSALVSYGMFCGDVFDIQLTSYSEESLHQDALFIFVAASHLFKDFTIYPVNY